MPIGWERKSMAKKYSRDHKNYKVEWSAAKRRAFCRRLIGAGWSSTHVDPDGQEDVFVKGTMRLLLDNHGIFVFERNGAGAWERTRGLSDDRIDNGPQRKPLIGPFNDGLVLDLESCEFVPRP
jgi:hypothetical protein